MTFTYKESIPVGNLLTYNSNGNLIDSTQSFPNLTPFPSRGATIDQIILLSDHEIVCHYLYNDILREGNYSINNNKLHIELQPDSSMNYLIELSGLKKDNQISIETYAIVLQNLKMPSDDEKDYVSSGGFGSVNFSENIKGLKADQTLSVQQFNATFVAN